MGRLNKFIVISFLIFAAACSGGSGGGDETTDAALTSSSTKTSIGLGTEETEEGTFFTIDKNKLGKEFLMHASYAEKRAFDYEDNYYLKSDSQALKSRIVRFQEDGDTLLMFESNDDYQPGNEISSDFIITSFPITNSGENYISFDFNAGMKNVFSQIELYSSENVPPIPSKEKIKPIESSYLKSIKIYDNAISVTASVTVRDASSLKGEGVLNKDKTKIEDITINGNPNLVPAEIIYYFTEYKNNPGYVPVKRIPLLVLPKLSYFETTPMSEKGSGTPYTNIMRRDLSKPITYYISDTTPAEYREAIKQGVLYWNKAFGKEILRVDMAPKGMTAPDFEHNIIQWLTQDVEGYSNADIQTDPRTGEILHSQIYIASTFADEVEVQKINRLSAGNTSVPELSQKRVNEIISDQLRRLVAHEMGHTLGLRHNFAGSVANEMTAEEEATVTRNYLQNGKLPPKGKLITNSIMDYLSSSEKPILGAMISDPNSDALPHDKYAIEWGYFAPDKTPKYNGLTYCEDDFTNKYEDCKTGDAGKFLIDRLSYDATHNFINIPRTISEIYLGEKTKYDSLYRRGPEDSPLLKDVVAKKVSGKFAELVRLFTSDDIKLLSIYLKHPDEAAGKISIETSEWLNLEITKADGMEEVLKIIDPTFFKSTADNFQKDLDKILSSPQFREAKLPEGGGNPFTDEEIDYIGEQAKTVLRDIERTIAYNITTTLIALDADEEDPRAIPYKPIEEIEKVEAAIAKWAEYILTEGESGLNFRYSRNTRSTAAFLLLKSKGPFVDWLDSYKPPIVEKLRKKLEAGLGAPINYIDYGEIPRDKGSDIADELAIYYMIAPKPPKTETEE